MRALSLLLLSTCANAQQYVISTIAGGSAPPTPVAATRASIGDPARVILDSAGNVYFSSLHSVFKVDAAGNLTRIAGNGRAGNSGDFGFATSAQLNNPMGMALDGAGNLYVADRDANVVRRISGGVISTVAIGLNQPFDVAVDSRGRLFVADTGNDRVVRVGADGTLADVAAGGQLNHPEGLAIDANDNLYIADTFNGRILRVSSDGRLSTIAGIGTTGVFSGDGGPAVNAAISLPTAVTLDPQGSVYIADFGNARVRKISDGVITTVLGSANGAPILEGEPAASTRLEGPTGVAVDRAGVIYFAEGGIGSGTGLARGDFRVWKVPLTGELRAFAGTGASNFAGDGGPASASQLNGPTAMSFDGQGNLFIADAANQRIRRISPGGIIETVLGTGTAGFAVEFGSPAGAVFNMPRGVVAEPGGAIYVADTLNNRVRKHAPGGNVSTYAGNGNAAYFGDGGQATSASINAPEGLALDAAGNLYIADTNDNAIRKVTPDGLITTIAGNGLTGFAGDGGLATRAQLNRPRAVAVDSAGNVYVADTGNHRVRRVDTAGNIATIAGNGATDFLPDDSAGINSSLSDPRGVAVDSEGNVYISDTGHNRVRKLFPTGAITTIAGHDGTCCYSGDSGLALPAQLNQPAGLMVDAASNVYVADTGNSAIRMLRPIATTVTINAVTNAASNLTGPVSPGELVTLYGAGMDGVKSVTFNGLSAPVLYSTTNQVGAVVPYAIAGSSAQVTVTTPAAISAPVSVMLAPVAPGIFTADSSGRGQALAVNQDGSRNGTVHPTAAGEVLTLYVTGEGQTTPTGVDGLVATSPAPVPIAPVTVTIGGAPAEVQYAGGAPGLIAGVMQVNVVVPDRVFGVQPVVVSIARVPSQNEVTVFVR
jgi:trimeric autotransporter adhesin